MDPLRLTFERLPPEMRENILRFLDRKTLLSACCVSRTWFRLISPVTGVWKRACESLGLQIKDGIDWKICRGFFVRLAHRWRSIAERCIFTPRWITGYSSEHVSAIYYHNGKLVTGSMEGIIVLWDCRTNVWLWVSLDYVKHPVTSIKFDDSIVVASYSQGSIVSWSSLTGEFVMLYRNPCIFAGTVDYMTEANLVFSAYSKVVGWNMSNGKLLVVKDLKKLIAAKVVLGSYPSVEVGKDSTVRQILVACRMKDSVVVWQATSTVVDSMEMDVTMSIVTVIKVPCPNRCSLQRFYVGDELYFEGDFLYFTKHCQGSCNGIVCKWDVTHGRMEAEFVFSHRVRLLLGVGKKYMLLITSDDCGDYLDVLDKGNSTLIIRAQIPRCDLVPSRFWSRGLLLELMRCDRGRCPFRHRHRPRMPYEGDLVCLGKRSWLDGFDGENDCGEVYLSVMNKNLKYVLEWTHRKYLFNRRYLFN